MCSEYPYIGKETKCKEVPIWAPLNPSSWPAEYIKTFDTESPMKRAGQPFELAPAYVYLASADSRYTSGQVMHVNGGTIVES